MDLFYRLRVVVGVTYLCRLSRTPSSSVIPPCFCVAIRLYLSCSVFYCSIVLCFAYQFPFSYFNKYFAGMCQVVSGKSCAVGSVMLSRLAPDVVVLCVNVPDVCCTDFISVIRAVARVALGTGGVLQYPPPYPVEEYVLRYVPRDDAHQLAIMPVCPALNVKVGNG